QKFHSHKNKSFDIMFCLSDITYFNQFLQQFPRGMSWLCGHFLGCLSIVHSASVNCAFMWCSMPQTISSSMSTFRALSISTSSSLLFRIMLEPISSPFLVSETPLLL